MKTRQRSLTVVALACAVALSFTAVASAKIINQRINSPGGEITVTVTGKAKKQKIALLDLKYICATGFGEINSSKIAGIAKTKVAKNGKFKMKKSGVKILNPAGGNWGKGSFVIKGKLVNNKKLTGTATVKNAKCGTGGIGLDAGN